MVFISTFYVMRLTHLCRSATVYLMRSALFLKEANLVPKQHLRFYCVSLICWQEALCVDLLYFLVKRSVCVCVISSLQGFNGCGWQEHQITFWILTIDFIVHCFSVGRQSCLFYSECENPSRTCASKASGCPLLATSSTISQMMTAMSCRSPSTIKKK